jgi:pimeloyl-ACP methyl ester carboxylesterase
MLSPDVEHGAIMTAESRRRARRRSHQAILLPGAVLPARLAYEALSEALAGDDVDAVAKDLELYGTEQPPPGYSLDLEIEGVLQAADEAGFERFHLVGYSGGGAGATAFAACHGDRLRSLALLEPAWIGNDGQSAEERRVWRDLGRIMALTPDQLLTEFVRMQVAPGVEPPPPPPGPSPPWMAKRPAGLRALVAAFADHHVEADHLHGFGRPVYYALGALSNQDLYGRMADRAGRTFGDFTLEVFEGRHHFDPPHRAEPERLARSLRALWARSDDAFTG